MVFNNTFDVFNVNFRNTFYQGALGFNLNNTICVYVPSFYSLIKHY